MEHTHGGFGRFQRIEGRGNQGVEKERSWTGLFSSVWEVGCKLGGKGMLYEET